jgi:fumarate hydratase class II
MTEFRIEKDSLGEVHVPKTAYYAAQTQRAVENFPITGLKPYTAFIWSMTVIKRAAAEVHKDLGLLDENLANAIILASEEILKWQTARAFCCGSVSSRRRNKP